MLLDFRIIFDLGELCTRSCARCRVKVARPGRREKMDNNSLCFCLAGHRRRVEAAAAQQTFDLSSSTSMPGTFSSDGSSSRTNQEPHYNVWNGNSLDCTDEEVAAIRRKLFGIDLNTEEQSNMPTDETHEIECIIDEEIDAMTSKHYQVQWVDWKSPVDGSVMTWVHTNDLSKRSEQVTRAWEAEKKKKLGQNLQRYADMGVPIASIGQNCFTRFNTTLSETVIWSWADHSSPQPLRNADLRGEVASVKATALGYRGVQHEESPSLSSYSEEDEDPVQIAQGVKRRAKSPPFAPPAKRFQVILEESDSDSMGTSRPPSRRSKGRPRRNEASLRLRRRVETAWNRIARNSGAATISLVNDVDDEEIPSSIDPATFTYLERSSYILPEGETSHSGLYEGCECEDGCISPDECACQSTEFADVIMHHGRRSFAYDRNGLYIFPEQFDFAVFECNHACLHLPTSVPPLIHPLDVPLQPRDMSKPSGTKASGCPT